MAHPTVRIIGDPMTAPSQNTEKSKFLDQVAIRLAILESWIERREVPWRTGSDGKVLRDEDGELIPDFVPTNFFQFCNWEPSKSSPASGDAVLGLRRISRQTLDQDYHSELKSNVDSKLKAVKACLTHQLERKNKTSVIAELQSALKLLEGIVDAQQRESRQARQQVGEITKRYRMRHDEQRRIIAQLKSDLAASELRVAELTAAFAKIAPLRPAKTTTKSDR